MSVQKDDVVGHQRHHHDQHLQLVVDPQEDRAGNQSQDAAVDEVLEQGERSGRYSGSLQRKASVSSKTGGYHQVHSGS